MKNGIKILAIGEVLWDILPKGKQLGGAPANFAFYCNALGIDTQLISAVGNDVLGEEILEALPYDTSLIVKNFKPTSQVDIKLVDGIPDYRIWEDVAWDYLELNKEAIAVIEECDAFCFGTLAQRSPVSKNAIRQLLEAAPKNCLKIFDVNLRQDFYSKDLIEESLQKTDLLKINDEELEVLSNLFDLSGSEIGCIQQLIKNYKIKWIALTKGALGSYLISDTEVNYQPIIKTEVINAVGAGDAFLAGLVTELLNGFTINEAHKQACEISSFVCGQNGAMNELIK